MPLKTTKDPILPHLIQKEDFENYERAQRFWRGLLTVLKDFHSDVYDDLSRLENLPVFANNSAAKAGGLKVGDFYRTSSDPSVVCVVF